MKILSKLILMRLFVRLLLSMELELSSVIGTGWIFILVVREGGFANSTLVAECYAARLALFIAHKSGLRYLILKGDSLDVISLFLDHVGLVHWAIYGPINDCLVLIKLFTSCSCIYVKRCANWVGNQLAKSGLIIHLY